MKVKNIILISFLTISLSTNASVLKIIDLLPTKNGVTKMLGQHGILKREVVTEVSATIKSALDDLTISGKGSAKDLNALKRRLETPEDKKKYEQMMEVFNRNPKKSGYVAPTQNELVEAINNLVELSQRYALRKTSGLSACVPCVNDSLDELGFKFVLVKKKGQSKKILKQMASATRSPKKTKQVASQRLKEQGFGEFDTKYVAPHEHEVLLYISYIEEFGSPLEKEFLKRLKKVSKVAPGQFNLFDESNGHKFFNILSTESSDQDLRVWTDLLDETYTEMNSKNLNTMDAFYSVLQKKIDSETDQNEKALKTDMLKYIKEKDCFAKK